MESCYLNTLSPTKPFQGHNFKAFKETFMNPPALEHLKDQISFFLIFVNDGELNQKP